MKALQFHQGEQHLVLKQCNVLTQNSTPDCTAEIFIFKTEYFFHIVMSSTGWTGLGCLVTHVFVLLMYNSQYQSLKLNIEHFIAVLQSYPILTTHQSVLQVETEREPPQPCTIVTCFYQTFGSIENRRCKPSLSSSLSNTLQPKKNSIKLCKYL